MINFKYLFFLIIIFLAGCGARIFNCDKISGYDKKIKNMTVIYATNTLGSLENYIENSEFNELSTLFAKAGVQTNLFLYSGLELNAKEHINSLVEKSDYVLHIFPERMKSTNSTTTITYKANLHDISINKIVWYANINISSCASKPYEEIGSKIIRNLQENNLL